MTAITQRSPSARRPRVVLADDHALVRSGLRTLLERDQEFQVVGEAGNGVEVLSVIAAQRPDVVLLDLSMPQLNGIDTAQRLHDTTPDLKVVVVSMHADEAYVLRALKAGVRGYVLKQSSETDVVSALRAVQAGHAYFSPEVSKLLADDFVRDLKSRNVTDPYDQLTFREKQVMQLLAEGESNKEIAVTLAVGLSTVESHRYNIFQKLNLHSIAELVLYAVRRGLL
ncbi:MAG TPA: response regulator transcription factor [Vicinamibacterales bacterium]|nr:response regulator transcription factor [Vicinamibacterales bacterium]